MFLFSRFSFLLLFLFLTFAWTSGEESEDSEPKSKEPKVEPKPFSLDLFKSGFQKLPKVFENSNSTKNGTLFTGGAVVSVVEGYRIGNKSVITLNKTQSFGPLNISGISDLFNEDFDDMFRSSRNIFGGRKLKKEGSSENILENEKEKPSLMDRMIKIGDKIKNFVKTAFSLSSKEDNIDSKKSDIPLISDSKDSKNSEDKEDSKKSGDLKDSKNSEDSEDSKETSD